MSSKLQALEVAHLPPGARVLVACSGGADSVALLLALQAAEFSCVVAHINHGTRQEESDADEEFVRSLAVQTQLPFAASRLSLPPGANESTMRDARYSALVNLAREYSCACIATGHTANDNLETVLLNWLRGATVSGFAGIAPTRQLEDGVLLVRPLLSATRSQVREYLAASGQSWREDLSNDSTLFLRNRVRHELIPKLVELDTTEDRLASQTLQASQILRDDLHFLEATAAEALNSCSLSTEPDLCILSGEKFRALPVALQRRVLRLAARQLEKSATEVSASAVEEVRQHILAGQRRAVWQWHRNLLVEWTGEYSGNRIRFKRV